MPGNSEFDAEIMVVTDDRRALDVFDRAFEMEGGSLRSSSALNEYLAIMKKQVL